MKARFKENGEKKPNTKKQDALSSFLPPSINRQTLEALVNCPDTEAKIELLNFYLCLVRAIENGFSVHPKVWNIFEAHLGMIKVVRDPAVKEYDGDNRLMATNRSNAERLRQISANYHEAMELMLKSIFPLLVQAFIPFDQDELREIINKCRADKYTPSQEKFAIQGYFRKLSKGDTDSAKRFIHQIELILRKITFIHVTDELFYNHCPNPQLLKSAWAGFWVSNHHLISTYPDQHLLFSDHGLKLSDNNELRMSHALHEINHFLINEFWKLYIVFPNDSTKHRVDANTVLPTFFTEGLSNIFAMRYAMSTEKGFDRLLMEFLNKENGIQLHSAEEILNADESMSYFEFTLFVYFMLNWLYLKATSDTDQPLNISGFNNIGTVLNEIKHAFDIPIRLHANKKGADLGISILSEIVDRALSSMTKKEYDNPTSPKKVLELICKDFNSQKDQYLVKFLLTYFPHEKITYSLAKKQDSTSPDYIVPESEIVESEKRKKQLIIKLREHAMITIERSDKYLSNPKNTDYHDDPEAVNISKLIIKLPLENLDESALTRLLSELMLLLKAKFAQYVSSGMLTNEMIRTYLDPFSYEINPITRVHVSRLIDHLKPIFMGINTLMDLPNTFKRIKETFVMLAVVVDAFMKKKYNPYVETGLEISDYDFFKEFLPDNTAFGTKPLLIYNLAQADYFSDEIFRFLKSDMFFCREHTTAQFILMYLIEGSNSFFTGKPGLLFDHIYHELIGHIFMSRCLRCKIVNNGEIQEIPSLLSFPPWILEGIANLMSDRFKFQPYGFKSFICTVPEELNIPTAKEIINSNTKIPYVYFSALFNWLMTVLGDPNERNLYNHEISPLKAKHGLKLFVQATHDLEPINISEIGENELSHIHTERILNKMCDDKGYNLQELLTIFDEIRTRIVKHLVQNAWYPEYDTNYRTAL